MKLQGQMKECPQRYLKFVRKIRTAVAFTRPVFLKWASIYSRKQLLNISNIDFGKISCFAISFRGFVVYKQPLTTYINAQEAIVDFNVRLLLTAIVIMIATPDSTMIAAWLHEL